jgi:hypothetical protein
VCIPSSLPKPEAVKASRVVNVVPGLGCCCSRQQRRACKRLEQAFLPIRPGRFAPSARFPPQLMCGALPPAAWCVAGAYVDSGCVAQTAQAVTRSGAVSPPRQRRAAPRPRPRLRRLPRDSQPLLRAPGYETQTGSLCEERGSGRQFGQGSCMVAGRRAAVRSDAAQDAASRRVIRRAAAKSNRG